MAKAKNTDATRDDSTTAGPPATVPAASVSQEDRDLAIQVVCDIFGCGRPEAATRLQSIDIAKLVELEKGNRRNQIPAMFREES